MEPHFVNQWRKIGIYECIKHSTLNFALDKNFIATFTSFWSVGSNSFLLPLGQISVTVLDVFLLLGMFSSGVEVYVVIVDTEIFLFSF